MTRFRRMGIDGVPAVLLAAVLVIVGWADRKTRKPPGDSQSGGDASVIPASVPLRLAVTPAAFDDMGKLLGSLGKGYQVEVVNERALRDPAARARFDAIFLTCATADGGSGAASLAASLREFVVNGGTLYASDLRFDTLAAAFPEAVDATAVAQGVRQDLRAEVVSPELREILGDAMPLHFDLEGWRPAAFRGEGSTVYLKGKFRTTAGVVIEAPLLVKFSVGKGCVLFTSFHNEKQNSELETKLLRHLVLSTVTASVEAAVSRTMARGGFSPQKVNLLSAGQGDPSMTRTYDHGRPGALSFTLGFEPRGARLRLEVVSPSGERFVQRGGSTVTIDVPNAAPGSWTYTAAPESLPYPNFPFTLSVGAAGKPAAVAAAPPLPIPTNTLVTGSVKFRTVPVVQAEIRGPQRIAVSEPQFDDMGKLLSKLGAGYRFKTLAPDDVFLNPQSLDDFDIVFLTCGGYPSEWAKSVGGSGLRPGLGTGTARPEIIEQFGAALRAFVERGGTLYASDLRYGMIAWAFPERRGLEALDETLLPDLEAAERAWFKAKIPAAKVGTVSETLRGAGLGPAMTEKIDRVIAAVESSSLVKGPLDEAGDDPAARVRKLCHRFTLPATDADIQAIARAMTTWDKAIGDAVSARSRSKMARQQEAILQAEQQIESLRGRIIRDSQGKGNQTVEAHVVDAGLKEILGETISLNFDANAWVPASFRGDTVVYLRGEYQALDGRRAEAPLLVKFKEGKGTVIFTSFHNEAQNSKQEEALLKYLVLSMVTAREQEIADKTMLSGGFSATKRSLESHSSGQPSVTKTYRSTKAGSVRFALTLAGAGARMKFHLVAPTGQVYEKEVQASTIIEADDAPAGEWRYTVTSLQVPYDNFPFSVSVGEGPSIPRPSPR